MCTKLMLTLSFLTLANSLPMEGMEEKQQCKNKEEELAIKEANNLLAKNGYFNIDTVQTALDRGADPNVIAEGTSKAALLELITYQYDDSDQEHLANDLAKVVALFANNKNLKQELREQALKNATRLGYDPVVSVLMGNPLPEDPKPQSD